MGCGCCGHDCGDSKKEEEKEHPKDCTCDECVKKKENFNTEDENEE